MTPTTYTPDALLARFRGWTAPELAAERKRLAEELAALRAGRRDRAQQDAERAA